MTKSLQEVSDRRVHLLSRQPNVGLQSRAFLRKLRRETAVRNDQVPLATENQYR